MATIIEMVTHTRLDCIAGSAATHAPRRRGGRPPRPPPQRVRGPAGRPAADGQRAGRPRAGVRGGHGGRAAARARLRRGRPRRCGASAPRCSSTGSASARPPTPRRRWSAWAATATWRSRRCRGSCATRRSTASGRDPGTSSRSTCCGRWPASPTGWPPSWPSASWRAAATGGSTRRWTRCPRAGGAGGRRVGARRAVEALAVAFQAALLVRCAPHAVADAFCAARLGDGGRAYGTLPARRGRRGDRGAGARRDEPAGGSARGRS